MRVLISTWGWRSHFYCLAPLGWALQAAGHEVRVACHPSLAAAVTTAGLAAVPLGEDLDFAEVFAGQIAAVGQLDADPDDARPAGQLPPEITADGGVVRFAAAILDELVEFGRWYRPELVIWEPFNLAAPVASAALKVPGVCQLWGPDSSVTLRLDREAVLGPLAGRYGLGAAEVALTGALTLDPVPPPMQVPLAGPVAPVRFVPYNGVAVLPEWLRRPPDRPRVCVTAGTMMAGAGLTGGLDLAAVIRAVATLDVEVAVLVEPAQRAGLASVPDTVRLADGPLALRLVLPSCAALVGQGGAGTTMTALVYGVPQLILPQVSDQRFNGERLAVTGAGSWLPAERADPDAVRNAVADLLGQAHWRDAAGRMRARIAERPTPAQLVPVLTDLAAAGRPTLDRPQEPLPAQPELDRPQRSA